MPSARLVVPLGPFAGLDEVGGIDLHVDIGVGHGQGARHLGGDALAHLGHRQEDFVGALGELDARPGTEDGGGAAAAGAGAGSWADAGAVGA